MDYEKWMQKAIDNLESKVKPNTNFEVKSLFEGHEWESLSKGERISFGRYFSSQVKDGNVPNIIALERAKNNHSRYQKVEKS